MSFRLTNAPGTFMDLMNRLFLHYLYVFVIVFIDDIFEYSKNDDDHMGHFRVVLQTLGEHQFNAKYSMYEFWLRSVTFHGHIIYSEGVEIYPRKMHAMKNWPRLFTHTNIMSFSYSVG